MDETACLLSPTKGKVLVNKNDKAAYSLCLDDKECYTVLITGNAAGELAPPMIVFSYGTIPAKLARAFPSDYVIGKSPTSWMTAETFYMYIANSFYSWCVKSGIKFPIVLYVGGHSSHLTMDLSNFCLPKQIVLMALCSNATHVVQPMDVALFGPLKKNVQKSCSRLETGRRKSTFIL